MQNALNETCRDLFIEGFESYMRVTTDGDKMHLQTGKEQDRKVLKVTQHVRDKRKGFVAHTCCYTASGLPFGIEWEHAYDDSTAAATERHIRVQLSPMSGQNNPPTLTNTEIAINRGYCLLSLLFNVLLQSGAHVLGTVEHSPMFPFTFDQKLSPNDTWQSVETRGFKAYMKKLSTKDKVLTGITYWRWKRGGVTLGLTTTGISRLLTLWMKTTRLVKED
jgi:hypothetical protein